MQIDNLPQFFKAHFSIIFLICILWVVGNILVALWLKSKKPKIDTQDIVYEERWQSGRSFRSIFTRFGGARNCLNIIFLKDSIVIKPHFPFDLFWPNILGLEHTIPYHSIVNCDIGNFFFGIKGIILMFNVKNGNQEKFVFTAKNLEKVQSLCRQGAR